MNKKNKDCDCSPRVLFWIGHEEDCKYLEEKDIVWADWDEEIIWNGDLGDI